MHVALAYPTRQGLAEYLAYGADVEHTAERINHAHGSGRRGRPSCSRWRTTGPARWPRSTLSDVLLVNPVRDGLNLVAKEGPLLNTADGVLVLSRQAGAWEELALGGRGALGRQPLRRGRHGRGAARRPAPWSPPSGPSGRPRCATAVRGRTAADWWDDQLAAAAAHG